MDGNTDRQVLAPYRMPLCVKGFGRPSSRCVRCPSGAVALIGGFWPVAFLVTECGRRLAATSRSFVLASLRALHLDLRLRRRRSGSDRGMASSALAAGRSRRVGAGPGSGLPEEPVPGVQAGRAGDRAVPRLPSRVPGTRRGTPGISPQAGEDGVADLPFQRPQGLLRGLALSQFLVVIGAALAVPVADLGDRRHVDGVVQPPVPAPAQPVYRPLAGGHLDGRGAVVGGEVIPAGKAGHVLDVPDHRRGDYRPDAEQTSQARPAGLHGSSELLSGLA